ncbi:hypothetical protein IW262DRAFT_1295001 [Armillaria fumosa]|nr:hypothetical protein IW262DRAFT_1295001 [Armillaria fumosa]
MVLVPAQGPNKEGPQPSDMATLPCAVATKVHAVVITLLNETEVTRNHSVAAHRYSTVQRQEPSSSPMRREQQERLRRNTRAAAGAILVTTTKLQVTRNRDHSVATPLLNSAAVGAVVVTTRTEGKGSDTVLVVHPGTQRAAVAPKQSKTARTAQVEYEGEGGGQNWGFRKGATAGFRFLREKRVLKMVMDVDEEASDDEETWGPTLGPALVDVEVENLAIVTERATDRTETPHTK